jgi:hypothetical protein
MQPQGASILDNDYLASLTAEINSMNACSELQEVVNAAFASIQAQVSAIENQIIQLQLIQELLSLPTDLASVISWITKFVTCLIDPILIPLATYIAQLEQTITALAALTLAIENAAARIEHCSITVPTISITVPSI